MPVAPNGNRFSPLGEDNAEGNFMRITSSPARPLATLPANARAIFDSSPPKRSVQSPDNHAQESPTKTAKTIRFFGEKRNASIPFNLQRPTGDRFTDTLADLSRKEDDLTFVRQGAIAALQSFYVEDCQTSGRRAVAEPLIPNLVKAFTQNQPTENGQHSFDTAPAGNDNSEQTEPRRAREQPLPKKYTRNTTSSTRGGGQPNRSRQTVLLSRCSPAIASPERCGVNWRRSEVS
jgi:hypothetical protein